MPLSRASPRRRRAMRALRRLMRSAAIFSCISKREPGAADLALVEEDGVNQAFDSAIEVGIVEDDEGRFAAQLQGQLDAFAGGGAADEAADGGRAGEGDFVQVFMGSQGGAGFIAAGDDINDARWQAPLRR